ncbi:MAG: PQQ-dependent sugar dehydrogenase [Planctomycetes bacterium]|jgi:glucose/arabinose dehydrogenase|nr:PQQ-dependent sugar dehydrogenase [Planctomycetota bacterium]
MNVRLAPWWLLPTLFACSGGGGGGSPQLDYGSAPLLLRAGEPIVLAGLSAPGSGFVATPPLPNGLQLDAATGAISGTPSSVSAGSSHVVSGMVGDRQVQAVLQLAVGAALPAEVGWLEPGFAIERFATLTEAPGKFAIAPDGRVFVTERQSGVIRLIDASGALLATPFATVAVTTGSHRGLLGLALSPQFATDGLVFATATVPAGSGKPERSVLYRWQEQGGIGQNRVTLLDDLPVSTINNGGALCFDGSGMLVLSLGDAETPASAQSDASLAGKLLRIDPATGLAAADNPQSGNRVFAKGLRNVWAMTIEPGSGALFAADNGPADNDELLLVQPGRNFEWGAAPGTEFGALSGLLLRLWPDVVVPTGLAFARPDAADWPVAFRESLYMGLYDEEIVLRLRMSGALRTEIDDEQRFVAMVPDGVRNKPVDVLRDGDGGLWLLTFAAIYRIDRIR